MSALNKAVTFHKQGRLQDAEHWYLQALSANFDNPECLYLLGTVCYQTGKPGLAANLFIRAIALKQEYFEPWNNLGNCYKVINKEDDARACFEKALTIKGRGKEDYADIYNNLATLHINSGEPEKGRPHAEKALELVPDHKDAMWNLALIHLETGNFKDGFALYHAGFKTKNRMYREYGREIPYWDGSPGKNLIVWGEQGIGDEILFSSILPDVIKMSKSVVLECHPRLVSIFKASFPGVTVYGTRKDAYIDWPLSHPELDAKIAMGDLGKHLRQNVNDFPGTPYLKVNTSRVEHYRQKLAKLDLRGKPKLKIGISWTGGYLKTRKDYRSIPLEMWKPIFSEYADFISLQYTPDAYKTIAEVEDNLDIRIHHWPSAVQNDDYGETAALVEALDMVITVNTSVHHLAGALGKECWTLTPFGKAWRYWTPDGVNSPWYSSVKIYQQEATGDWNPVMEKVVEDLRMKLRTAPVRPDSDGKVVSLCR